MPNRKSQIANSPNYITPICYNSCMKHMIINNFSKKQRIRSLLHHKKNLAEIEFVK